MRKIVIAAFLIASLGHAHGNVLTSTINNAVTVKIPNTFKKIEAKELPQAVVEALLKEYPTSKLGAAYKNHEDKYKLIMVLQSGTRRTVYIDAYGRWLKG